MIVTLFSPWRKDVSFHNWRGFQPIKSAQAILENLFSRTIGAIVRAIVALAGCGLFVASLIVSSLALLIYVILPAVPVVIIMTASLQLFGTAVFVLLLAVVAAYFSWWSRQRLGKIPYGHMTLAELHAFDWFERVYERIGVSSRDVTPELLSDYDAFAAFLKKRAVTSEEFEKIMRWEIEERLMDERTRVFWQPASLARIRPIGRQWHYGYTVMLDRFSTDLTKFDASEYRDVHLVDHMTEMEMMEVVLTRPSQNNVLLVGDPGIGKRTLVHALAKRIREGFYDETPLRDKRVVLFDLGEALSSVAQAGQNTESFLHHLFTQAAYAGNVIIVVENFEEYFGARDSGRETHLGAVLNGYLNLPHFHLVGLTTPHHFHQNIAQEKSLMKYCEVVEVEEMTNEETGRVLYDRLVNMESKGRVLFTFQALRRMIHNANRYNNTAPLPERALDLATEIANYHFKEGGGTITENVVDDYVGVKTGIPLGEVGEQEKGKLLNLEEHLRKRIVGQEEAVKECAEAVRTMRAGIQDPNKPAASFLFLGPTGVGKTEMAKAVAESYFGSEENMVRLDMSEYQGPQALERLIGSRESGEPGYLTTAAKDNPYTLLLLDEIEKAEPRVLDVFLQILDEGMVTDGYGDKVSFRNMIIIATSNAGALFIKKLVEGGRDLSKAHKEVIEAVLEQRTFRVEFLNRFSHVILFRPLAPDELLAVTKLLLARSAQQLEKQHNIVVRFADDLVPVIVERGHDPIFGARSVQRYIADVVEDALARKIIAGDVMRGQDVVFSAKDFPREG